LGGNGTFGGLTVNGGTVAPGNSIGTFTVNGNFAQGAGSIYQVEVNPQGQSDLIAATGTATISGGTVAVQAQSGTYARNTTYTILTAAGGVSGAYSSVTSNFAFLTPSLSYNANNVFLTLFQNQSAFAAGAQTANQYAVGAALDQANASAAGDFNTVLNALSVLSTTAGPAALNQISGQPYADFGTFNVANNALFMNALGQQMALARGGSGSGQRQALAELAMFRATARARSASGQRLGRCR
jgi:outer membrane autotransporter protein